MTSLQIKINKFFGNFNSTKTLPNTKYFVVNYDKIKKNIKMFKIQLL